MSDKSKKTAKMLKWQKTEPPNFINVPERPGVYIISTRQETDHEYEVKFVGQANNLRTRINGHWSRQEKNPKLKAHIAEKYIMKLNYAIVESQEDRDGMELYMYELFKPPFNLNAPPGKTAVSCTIPAVRKSS